MNPIPEIVAFSLRKTLSDINKWLEECEDELEDKVKWQKQLNEKILKLKKQKEVIEEFLR